ncbi:hypothetical protein ABGB07_31900 [Micromonosporaceae bacterium B7E4]
MAATYSTAAPLPWLVKRGLLALWRELPVALVAGALTLAAAIPLAVAAGTAAPGWLLAGTTVPAALGLTGLAHFAAGVADGDATRMRGLRLDPVLALVLAGGGTLAGLGLSVGGVAALAGAAGAAVLLVVAPLALAYGGVRGRTGLAALRGGTILAAVRPSWALTLLALGVLGGFAAVASLGILAIAVLPLLATVASSVVAGLVEEINHSAGQP